MERARRTSATGGVLGARTCSLMQKLMKKARPSMRFALGEIAVSALDCEHQVSILMASL